MRYAFQDTETGESIDLDFPIGKAPKFGRVITRDGRRLRRVIVLGKSIVDGGVKGDPTFVSGSLPEAWPWAKNHVRNPDGTKGRCLFSGQRELKQAIADARKDGEPVVYNEMD